MSFIVGIVKQINSEINTFTLRKQHNNVKQSSVAPKRKKSNVGDTTFYAYFEKAASSVTFELTIGVAVKLYFWFPCNRIIKN